MTRHGPAVVGAVVLVAVLGLTGCGGAPAGPSTSPTPSATPTPEVTSAETPPAEPTPEPPAAPEYGAQAAYADCVEFSAASTGFAGAPTYAPFGSAYIVERPDGLWYVYIEVTIPSAPTDPQKYIAAECVIGPDTPDGEWIAGARTRAPVSELEPYADLPGED